MRVISRRTLELFWKKHPDAEQPLKAWHEKVLKMTWTSRESIEKEFGGVKIIKGDRARFKIKGNDFRLLVAIDYKRSWVYIKFVGTHAEYNKIDAETINQF